MFPLKIYFVLILTGTLINGATSMTHTFMNFLTSSTEVPNFPEFVTASLVNGHQVCYYDSKTRRSVPKTEWMKRMSEDDPQYWEKNTQVDMGNELVDKGNLETVRLMLNRTEGQHIHQFMTGCAWDDETDEIRGFYQSAFDGEDFISLDWETQTFVAAKPQAFSTKLLWERVGDAARIKNEVINACGKDLKTIVSFGEKTLKRKELPLVSLLQKSSSSPVTCHATGFYPEGAMLFWTKDGDELYEDVEYWEVLPNHDGTFQKSADLDLSSVPVEDWGRYNCVFQLSGVPHDLITKLDPKLIRTNEKKPNSGVAIAAVLSALGLAAFAAFGIVLYRRFHNNNVVHNVI